MKLTRPIAIGTTVYHGTYARSFRTLRGPAWVTSSARLALTVARVLGEGRGEPRVLAFKVLVPPLLLLRESDSSDASIADWLSEETGEQVDPDQDSLVAATCSICDGWIVASAYDDAGEVLLCDPMSFLEYEGDVVWAYHATDRRGAAGIRRRGLELRNASSQRGETRGVRGRAVFFSPTPALASVWGDVIFRFPWPEDAQEDPYSDATMVDGEVVATNWYSRRPISTKHLIEEK